MVSIPVIFLLVHQESGEVPYTVFGRTTVPYRTVEPGSFEIYGTGDGSAGTVKYRPLIRPIPYTVTVPIPIYVHTINSLVTNSLSLPESPTPSSTRIEERGAYIYI